MIGWVERWVSPVLSPQFWQEEMKERPYELLGFTSVVGIVAYGVKTLCGKRFAAGVVVVSFANYSNVRTYVVLHKEELVQVVTNLTVPLFCLAMPQMIKVMLPVYVVWIGVTIMQQRKKAEGQKQEAVESVQQQATVREKELQEKLSEQEKRAAEREKELQGQLEVERKTAAEREGQLQAQLEEVKKQFTEKTEKMKTLVQKLRQQKENNSQKK